MAPLLNIPLEVLLLIASHLTTPEYGSLRATCKYIEASLFTSFSKEFFSKRQFALTEFSIQALVDIAKSRLGSSLTHLIIHLEHPQVAFVAGVNNYHLVRDAASHNQILSQSLSHSVFISTGRDFEMLSEAIRHLPNLETIGMRDFHSNSRTRDDTEWHSYGCPTFQRTTGARLALPNNQPDRELQGSYFRHSEYTSHVFLTILRAMGSCAGASPKAPLLRHRPFPTGPKTHETTN
jgi:hypothetical protein